LFWSYQRWARKFFLKSPQIANPQILGLISLSQILKFLKYASPQIANEQIFMINPQIANQLCDLFAEGPQIGRFAICETYLRTAHLW
jgi:hypothetical protein